MFDILGTLIHPTNTKNIKMQSFSCCKKIFKIPDKNNRSPQTRAYTYGARKYLNILNLARGKKTMRD